MSNENYPTRISFLKEFRKLAEKIFTSGFSVIETEDITPQYEILLDSKPSDQVINEYPVFDAQTIRLTRIIRKIQPIAAINDSLEYTGETNNIEYLSMDYCDKEYGEIHRFIAAAKGNLGKLLIWANHKAKKEIKKPILSDEIYNKTIGAVIRFLLHRKKLKKLGVSYNKGILLWGEPGNGKTMITNYVKKYVESRGMNVSIMSFNDVKQGRPMSGDVIILDDFSIEPLTNRTPECDFILSEMDGPNKHFGRVYIITTNELNLNKQNVLPELVRPGRIDSLVKLERPNKLLRLRYVNDWKINLTTEQREEIAELSKDFSFAQLNRLQTELAMMQIEGLALDVTKALSIVDKKIGDKVLEISSGNNLQKIGFLSLLSNEGDE